MSLIQARDKHQTGAFGERRYGRLIQAWVNNDLTGDREADTALLEELDRWTKPHGWIVTGVDNGRDIIIENPAGLHVVTVRAGFVLSFGGGPSSAPPAVQSAQRFWERYEEVPGSVGFPSTPSDRLRSAYRTGYLPPDRAELVRNATVRMTSDGLEVGGTFTQEAAAQVQQGRVTGVSVDTDGMGYIEGVDNLDNLDNLTPPPALRPDRAYIAPVGTNISDTEKWRELSGEELVFTPDGVEVGGKPVAYQGPSEPMTFNGLRATTEESPSRGWTNIGNTMAEGIAMGLDYSEAAVMPIVVRGPRVLNMDDLPDTSQYEPLFVNNRAPLEWGSGNSAGASPTTVAGLITILQRIQQQHPNATLQVHTPEGSRSLRGVELVMDINRPTTLTFHS